MPIRTVSLVLSPSGCTQVHRKTSFPCHSPSRSADKLFGKQVNQGTVHHGVPGQSPQRKLAQDMHIEREMPSGHVLTLHVARLGSSWCGRIFVWCGSFGGYPREWPLKLTQDLFVFAHRGRKNRPGDRRRFKV